MEQLLKSLNIDPTVLLFNGALFLVLLVILDRLFWKPMMRHLDQRKQEIAGAYTAVENTRREMENLRIEYQGHLARIEAEARSRIQQTVRDAQTQREDIIARAREQAAEVVRRGAETVEQEKARTLVEMHQAMDDAAMDALSKALGQPAGPAQRLLVDEYIERNVLRS